MKNLLNSNSIINKKKNKSLQSKFKNVRINSKMFRKNFNWKPKFKFKDAIKDLLSQ